jgi:hypothetical protein
MATPLWCRVLGHRFTKEERHAVPNFDRIGEYHVFEQCARCGCMGRLKRTVSSDGSYWGGLATASTVSGPPLTLEAMRRVVKELKKTAPPRPADGFYRLYADPIWHDEAPADAPKLSRWYTRAPISGWRA